MNRQPRRLVTILTELFLRAKQFEKVMEDVVLLRVNCRLHMIDKVKEAEGQWRKALPFLTRKRRDSVVSWALRKSTRYD